jgi:hypothetical protein
VRLADAVRRTTEISEIQSLAFHVVSNGRPRARTSMGMAGGSLADECCPEELAAWVEHGRDSPGPSG